MALPAPQAKDATDTVAKLNVEPEHATEPERETRAPILHDTPRGFSGSTPKESTETKEEPKPDAEKNLALQMYKLIASADDYQSALERLKEGKMGYGDLKKSLFQECWDHFEPARARREELANNLDFVLENLKKGSEKARSIATVVLDRAKKNSGLI